MLSEMTIDGFLEALSSDAPVPGGGSVAALSAALAASLSAMVANLTVGKKGYEAHFEAMQDIVDRMQGHRRDFCEWIDTDAHAFDGVMRAYKMPKRTDEEKQRRSEAIQTEMKRAAEVPLEVAERIVPLFDDLKVLVAFGNRNAETDALVAAMMARTAILSALYNVKINLGAIKDSAYVKHLEERVLELEHMAVDKEKEILALSKL